MGRHSAELHATSKEIVLGDVKFGGNLDDADCVMVKVRIMKGGNRQKAG